MRRPTSDASKYDAVAARLFLSQSGFLSLENRNHFQALQVSAQRPFNLLQNFKNLDLTPQRECFSVGVLCVTFVVVFLAFFRITFYPLPYVFPMLRKKLVCRFSF